VSDAGIAGNVQTRPALRHMGSTDHRSRIAWAAKVRAAIAKFVFASGQLIITPIVTCLRTATCHRDQGLATGWRAIRTGTRRKSI